MRICLLPSSRIWFHATKSFRKGKKKPPTILKLGGWFETNSVSLRNKIFSSASAFLKKGYKWTQILLYGRGRGFELCGRDRRIAILILLPFFTIDSSGSKVFQCSKRNPLKAEKKGIKVFECQGQILSWKTFIAKGSKNIYLMSVLNNCRQLSGQLGPTCLPTLGSFRCSPKAYSFFHETLQL